MSLAKHEESLSETENPEIQADDPKVVVNGEGKATQASVAVMSKNTNSSFAFPHVKTKILEGKANAQYIKKALDDARKTADIDFAKPFSQSEKEQQIMSIADLDARPIVSALATGGVKMCLLTTVT